MADGFSCKEQIEQDTPRHGLHLAEVMSMAIHDGPHGPAGIYPEKRFVEPRINAQRRSMKRAGIVTGLVAAAAGVAWFLARRR